MNSKSGRPQKPPATPPTVGTTRSPGSGRLAESLARIGVRLSAHRVELFVRNAHAAEMELAGWWAAFGHAHDDPTLEAPIPESWFPWDLGNLKPATYTFVCNAGPLPARPVGSLTVADLGMGSCLHLPLTDGFEVIGAACVYWASERADWPTDAAEHVTSVAKNALLDCVRCRA